MQFAINFDHAVVVALFDQRFRAYNPRYVKTEAIYKQCDSYSEIKRSVADTFQVYQAAPLEVGTVEMGIIDDVGSNLFAQFMLITSKVGKILIYKDGTEIKYLTEDQFSICQSVKAAGFNGNAGTVETYTMMDHLFKIPDSYAGVNRF